MDKVKTFGIEMLPLHAHQELLQLDAQVNEFLAAGSGRSLIGVSDMPVTDDKGETIGIIRCVSYREG